MITHLIKSINWIDVAVFALFVWIVFVAVKNGFISELFKFLGVVVAVFVSLHYYSSWAAWLARKTHLTWSCWDLLVFAGLWFAVALFFKFIRNGILVLFKVETNHQGFDKYAAGVVGVARGILVSSMVIFLVLLVHYGPMTRMAFRSYSFKISGHAAVGTYSFLYNHLVDKLFMGEHYNAAAGKEILNPKP